MRYVDADNLKSIIEKATDRMVYINGVKAVDMGAIIGLIDRQPTAEVVPKSEVEKIIEETFKRVRENFVISPLCKSALSDLEVELKKKYTEEKT